MPTDLIQRLDRWLSANRPEYYSTLLPGVPAATLDEFTKRFSLNVPDTFRSLYQWRNGSSSSANLQHNWMLMSLEDIVSSKEVCDGMIGTDFEDPRWWRKSWIPFLHNGGGDHLCIDTAAIDGGTPGQLLEFWHADSDRPVRYPSFDAWLHQLVESMEAGTLELY